MFAQQKTNNLSDQPSAKSSETMPLIVILLIVLGFATALFFVRRARSHKYDGFAQCLSAKQVKMYGLYWCVHCADQKKLFSSSFRYVTYIECGVKGSREEAAECKQAGVKNFPTWDFGNSRHEGTVPLSFISAQSGCPLP